MSQLFIFSVPESLARPPLGVDSFTVKDYTASPFREPCASRCRELLEEKFRECNEERRHLHTQGEGVGVVLEKSPFCHMIERDGVLAVVAGEVSVWPGHDVLAEAHDAFMRGAEPVLHDDAEWLLEIYSSFKDFSNASDLTEAALRALNRVEGGFAFCIFDSFNNHMWAARDPEGVQALYWGATEDGQLLFATNPERLAECSPSATPFPSGCLYASAGNALAVNPAGGWVVRGEQQPGLLLSFVESRVQSPGHRWRDVKAIPRVRDDGVLCGAVYKVSSEQQLAGGVMGH